MCTSSSMDVEQRAVLQWLLSKLTLFCMNVQRAKAKIEHVGIFGSRLAGSTAAVAF